jgi:hypothetical protein
MWRVSQQGIVDGNFGYNSTKAKCGNSIACNWQVDIVLNVL